MSNNNNNNGSSRSAPQRDSSKRFKPSQDPGPEPDFEPVSSNSSAFPFILEVSKLLFRELKQKYGRLVSSINKLDALRKVDSPESLPAQLRVSAAAFQLPGLAAPVKADTFAEVATAVRELEKVQLAVLMRELEKQINTFRNELDEALIVEELERRLVERTKMLSALMPVKIHLDSELAAMIAKAKVDLLNVYRRFVVAQAERKLAEANKKETRSSADEDAAMHVEETTTLKTIDKIVNKKVRDALASIKKSIPTPSPSQPINNSRSRSSSTRSSTARSPSPAPSRPARSSSLSSSSSRDTRKNPTARPSERVNRFQRKNSKGASAKRDAGKSKSESVERQRSARISRPHRKSVHFNT
jgi:hypothetical protein